MRKKYALIAVIALIFILFLSIVLHPKKVNINSQPFKIYISLGDSVSAGVGLENYSDPSACNRTIEAYPSLVAQSLYLKNSNLSCSGATLTNGVLGNQIVNQLSILPQLDQLFKVKTPYLISLTVGANDIGWTDFISKCYTGVCGGADDTNTLAIRLNSMSSNLDTALKNIQNNYVKHVPKMLVTGYYQVLPANKSNCSDIAGIDQSELLWARDQQQKLNVTIESVVQQYSFAKYVPTDFSGHELCSSDPWVQGINSAAPYHPNDKGQTAISIDLVKEYKTFK